MACLELPAGLSVLLLSKDAAPRSASRWAQGGIAAVTRPEDSFASHYEDTLRAGAGLCDPAAVALLVHEAPTCVEHLLQLGMDFDRDGAGLSTTLEAAHSHRRVLHAQDRTGGALVDALEREVISRPGLVQRKGVAALALWVDGGRCHGLQILEGSRLRWLRAGAVVLASGGGGHLFANTTNPPQATGDGVVMAWQAGAVLRDLEFVQFHPTALMLPGAPHFLISEAVRGEGARLLDRQGRSPVGRLAGGDLAPRDQVSRALVRCMQEQRLAHVWLDLRPVGDDRLLRQFPTILGRCREFGLEPLREPIPVAPAAHYWMGGVSTDLNASTSLKGLYAVGEVACTGVHGANRLASNSLMECLVFARQLRHIDVATPASGSDQEPCHRQVAGPYREETEPEGLDLQTLRSLCWRVAGVEREGAQLRQALRRLGERNRPGGEGPGGGALGPDPGEQLELEPRDARRLLERHELSQQRVLARLLMEAAAFRQESRGGHFRLDAAASQPFWARHSLQRRGEPIGTGPLGVPFKGPLGL
ncbi:L-aspartate oxidase [Cyanobium sp. Morenito 9A2]|uniref:L-aspartate oxidase n=1 Tax=Cyanobium sp. Morenito 9A2 TaxID=2823718 RepID=UPI0037BF0920